MAKRLHLVPPSNLAEGISKPVDWTICILCQSTCADNLVCPANNTNVSLRNAGYATLAKNLQTFAGINALPTHINIKMFDEDSSGMEQTFLKRQAKWHKKCALNYNSTMFKRAKKRKLSEGEKEQPTTSSHERKPRSSCSKDVCFFCGGFASAKDQLFNVTTFHVDQKVRECATTSKTKCW